VAAQGRPPSGPGRAAGGGRGASALPPACSAVAGSTATIVVAGPVTVANDGYSMSSSGQRAEGEEGRERCAALAPPLCSERGDAYLNGSQGCFLAVRVDWGFRTNTVGHFAQTPWLRHLAGTTFCGGRFRERISSRPLRGTPWNGALRKTLRPNSAPVTGRSHQFHQTARKRQQVPLPTSDTGIETQQT
jgi:hypothetical protein